MTRVLRPWRTRTTLHRSLTQWRLLLLSLVVAVLACSLITSLGVLVAATEERAVRSALSEVDVADTEIEIRLTSPVQSVAESESDVELVVAGLIDGAATAEPTSVVLSDMHSLRRPGLRNALLYFGEFDRIRDNAVLTEGEWPSGVAEADEPIAVALPAAGADAASVEVGDRIELRQEGGVIREVDVVGLYEPVDPGSAYWQPDRLRGDMWNPTYEWGGLITDGIGPLVVPDGTLDALELPVERVVVRSALEFVDLAVDDLEPLVDRLSVAPETVPVALGEVAESVNYGSTLGTVVGQVATALTITRGTVIIVSLLLLVIAIATLTQAARLLVEARSSERQLMRARGASGSQLLGLAVIEAVAIAIITAVVSPHLARWVYQAIAAQPAMANAGMSFDPGTPLIAWLIAATVAVIFAAVLVAPLLRRGGTFLDAEQSRSRQRKLTGIQRSGLDVALLLLAGVAYWQLQSYRSPVGGPTSLWLDPVLVAAPGLALLAGALLCVRLIPAASRAAERLGSSARGAILPLAAWEVGRRSQRATAAVLLLTLALAVGTFSQSFLATWRQSQHDQAAFEVGAPVLVQSSGSSPSEALALESELAGDPEPVLRRTGLLAAPDLGNPFGNSDASGVDAVVLGIGPEARAMLDEGRLASEGGAELVELLDREFDRESGVDLPGDVRGIAATVKVGDPSVPLPGVAVILRAIVEDGNAVVSTIELGTVPADNAEYDVEGFLAAADDELPAVEPMRLVGLQALVFVDDPGAASGNLEASVSVRLGDLEVLHLDPESDPRQDGEPRDRDDYDAVAVEVDTADLHWRARAARSPLPVFAGAPEGWQIGMRFTVPVGLQSRPQLFTVSTWPGTNELPVVLSGGLADEANGRVDERFTLVIDGVNVPIRVAGIVDAIPGGGEGRERSVLSVGAAQSAAELGTIVVDQEGLADMLALNGAAGTAVDEWWVDVEESDVAAYVDGLPDGSAVQTRVGFATVMLEHPLRVATQGAVGLVIAAAALLAAIGFAVHATGSFRSRATEFAQLRAIGLARRGLTRVVAAESVVLGVIGTVFGVGLGVLLGWLVGPLIGGSASGQPPVPEVLVVIPWAQVGLLALEVAAVLVITVLVVARAQRAADPAAVLRMGDER